MSDSLYKNDHNTRTKSTKNTSASANHLLNFSYERYQPPQHSQSSNRRRTNKKSIVPYSKERYVQANFHFIVSEEGDYRENLTDPDLLVDWANVEQVTFQSHTSFDCPICLQPPVAAKISKCGHVFCWSCLIRHISYGNSNNKQVGKCPICFEYINLKDVKSVVIDFAHKYEQGDNIKFILIKRSKGSTIPLPRSAWRAKTEQHPEYEDKSTHFARFRIASDVSEIIAREQLELDLSAREADSEQDIESLSYITLAQDVLADRKSKCLQKQLWLEKEKESSKEKEKEKEKKEERSSLSQSGNKTRSRSNSQEFKGIPVNIEPLPSATKEPQYSGWHHAFRNINSSLRKEISEDLHMFSEDEEDESAYEEEPESENSQNVHEESPQKPADLGSDEEYEEYSEDFSSTSPNKNGSIPTLLSVSPHGDHNNSNNNNNHHSNNTRNGKSANSQQAVDKGMEDDHFYFFYQAADGQQSILHPLDCQILLREFGSIENLPEEIEGKILESEVFSQTEAMRRKNRALGHLPINSSYELVEIDLRQIVSRESLKPFYDEIFKRHHRRQSIKKKKEQEKRKEEAIAVAKRNGPALQAQHFPPAAPQSESSSFGSRDFADNSTVHHTEQQEYDEGTEEEQEDEDLRRAIEASLQQESSSNNQPISLSKSSSLNSTSNNTNNNNNNNNSIWTQQAQQRRNSLTNGNNNNSNWGIGSTATNGNAGSTGSFLAALKSPAKKEGFVLNENTPVKKKNSKKGTQYILMSNNSTRRYN